MFKVIEDGSLKIKLTDINNKDIHIKTITNPHHYIYDWTEDTELSVLIDRIVMSGGKLAIKKKLGNVKWFNPVINDLSFFDIEF